MIDRRLFFDVIRQSIFDGGLTQMQVDGISAMLDEAERRGTKATHLAYLLATPMIETGGRFEPITESLNYTASALKRKFGGRISVADADKYGRTTDHPADQEAIGNRIYGGKFGREQLGNTEAGDGYKFRGRNLPQFTGRRIYTLLAQSTGVDVVRDPSRALELRIGVAGMFDAMETGWFTGKKLSDYLDGPTPDFVNARRTINGVDRARDIAAFAEKFLAAIVRATMTSAGKPPERPQAPLPPPPDMEPTPAPSQAATGFLAALLAILRRIFGGK